MVRKYITSRPYPGEVVALNLTEKLFPGKRIVPTDEMRRTAPFSSDIYLPQPSLYTPFAFTSDPDTGIGRFGDDQLSLVAGGIKIIAPIDG